MQRGIVENIRSAKSIKKTAAKINIRQDIKDNFVKYLIGKMSLHVLVINPQAAISTMDYISKIDKKFIKIKNNILVDDVFSPGTGNFSDAVVLDKIAVDYLRCVKISNNGALLYKIDNILEDDNYRTRIELYFVGKDAYINRNRFYDYINKKYMMRYSSRNKHGTLYIRHIYGIDDDNHTYVDIVNKKDIINKDIDTIEKYIDDICESNIVLKKYNINTTHGILLYGAPGTGKTSIAKYIMTKIGTYGTVINCAMPQEDFSKVIFKYLKNMHYNSNADMNKILIIEEIDQLFVNSKVEISNEKIRSNNNEDKVKLIMQLLDGLISPDNLIVIATTNHYDMLSPEFIRDGRFDLKIEMCNLNNEEAIRFCNKFDCDPNIILRDAQYPINPAYLQRLCVNDIVKNVKNKVEDN